MNSEKINKFKDTLNLPTTQFSIRANAATTEPAIRAQWTAHDVDGKAYRLNEGKEKFVLHDGPPYANGHIHMGTAFNKTLKDIVCKSQRMTGKHVPFKPGWDCHGLPIELKVGGSKEGSVSVEEKLSLKKACREFAQEWIETQQKEFMQLGVLADWRKRYSTMHPGYEADIVRAFATFVEKGYIERKGKTVPWCSSCKTVLAHAEIEHKDRKDPSLYVLFPLPHHTVEKIDSNLLANNPNLQVSVLIWTTTPWTLPLNRAVVIHPTAHYVLIKGRTANEVLLLGKDLAAAVCHKAGIPLEVIAEVHPSLLQASTVGHPFLPDLEVPFILDTSVLTTDGTAAVHSAPGCGPEDYLIAVKNGLDIFSPLSADGKYTHGIQPAELEGMPISDGQIWVIKKLAHLGRLFHKETLQHAYPHCWRCKNGLMFRATDQWFCSLEKDQLVPKTLQAIEKEISFIPDWGKNRLAGSVSTRTEWCISRQRQWGVPIIALFCQVCKHTYAQPDFIRAVADQIALKGIEYWDEVTIEQMVNTGVIKSLSCVSCSNQDAAQFRKESDIIDVWFESGVSHFAVLSQDSDLEVPADMYLEGSDQHRAWFQSALLTAMVLNNKPSMRSIMTHGYVVDEKGYKMSKSLGNVTAPEDVIKKYSVDILRLWVAGTDFEKDIVISDTLLGNIAEVYRKIRNTCRFALANLYDFSYEKDSVPVDQLLSVDTYALAKLVEFEKKVKESYAAFHFTMIYQLLAAYTANDLSAFYFDIIKDRLYAEKASGHERRSAQTVLYVILDSLTKLMAPILSFLAEEVTDHYLPAGHTSVHLMAFSDTSKVIGTSLLQEDKGEWHALERLRHKVLKAIEPHRAEGTIKHSLEARVKISLNSASEDDKILIKFIKGLEHKEDVHRFFKDWFIVSQCDITIGDKEEITVQHALGTKCPRCWQWEETAHEDGLCSRCHTVLS